jgi:hypothetical protein
MPILQTHTNDFMKIWRNIKVEGILGHLDLNIVGIGCVEVFHEEINT